MPVFEYKALQANGVATTGQLEANGRQDAMRALEERGFMPVKLSESTSARAQTQNGSALKLPGKGKLFGASKKVPFAALEDFTRSLSSLLSASVPLSRALTILYQETAHPAAASQWRALHDLVVDGVSLADAMDRAPEVFPRIYVGMVDAGEAGGF